jgi:radical SAM superfamily enzyme YgiQ (UPF0313 family)
MREFDLVLINTPAADRPSDMRLGLLTLASYVRKQGFNATIIDGSLQAIKKQLVTLDLKRSLIGITATTEVVPVAYELCDFVKGLHPEALCLMGGNHATALPERTLRESRFDLLVTGEGELTLTELLRVWREGGELKLIPGTASLEDGSFVHNGYREMIKNLDVIPFPAYDLVDMRKHFGGIRYRNAKTRRCLSLLISRGCPFDCVFCGSKVMWSRKLRWHSVDYIIELILKVEKDFQIDSINFLDDELLVSRERIIALAERLIETGISKRLRWECHSTVTSLNEDIAQMIKRAGCCSVRFGLESGSQKSLNFLKQGRIKLNDSRRAIEVAKKVGLGSFGSFIIGSPNETLDDIVETIEFIQQSGLDGAAIFAATPYPGTDLYRIGFEKGYLEPDVPWSDFVVERFGGLAGSSNKVILRNEHFSAEQIQLIRDYIEINVIKPLNFGRRPKSLDHRREIERILCGDLNMAQESFAVKLGYLIQHGLERPDRILPYFIGKSKDSFRRSLRVR